MRTNKQQMWNYIADQNKLIGKGRVSLPVSQLKRLVEVVWDTSKSSEHTKAPAYPTGFEELFGGFWR